MSTLPSDLTSRVGQEVTLGQIFSAGWRTHKANFWPALGLLILVGLVSVLCGIALFVPLIVLLAIQNYVGAVVAGGLALVVWFVLQCLFWDPIMAAYQWSLVCCFDGRNMSLNDLFYGIRTRWSCLASLAALEKIVSALPIVAYVAIVAVTLGPQIWNMIQTKSPPGGAFFGGIAIAVLGLLAVWLATIVIQMLFFLAPLVAFTESTPSVRYCLSSNLTVLKRRFGTFLLVFFFPVLAGIAVAIVVAPIRMAADLSMAAAPIIGLPLMGLALVVQLGLTWWSTILAFSIKAAFFRAVSGYTLADPQRYAQEPWRPEPGTPTPPISPLDYPVLPTHPRPADDTPIPYDTRDLPNAPGHPGDAPATTTPTQDDDNPYRTDNPWQSNHPRPPHGEPS